MEGEGVGRKGAKENRESKDVKRRGYQVTMLHVLERGFLVISCIVALLIAVAVGAQQERPGGMEHHEVARITLVLMLDLLPPQAQAVTVEGKG